MKPEELKELQEKAALWDSLSPTLKQIFVSQIGYGETIQNTSNASSHLCLLEEESKEMCEVRNFDKDIEKYDNELYCSMCGNDNKDTFIYDRAVANGEVWDCKNCGRENIVNHEPKADDY